VDHLYGAVFDGSGNAFSHYGRHAYAGSFLPAGIVYLIAKMFASGHFTESLSFAIIFGIHTLVYGGLFYLVSVVMAKAIAFIDRRLVRSCLTGAFCLGMVAVTRLPLYGGGGHGPMQWHPLAKILDDFNRSYGAGTVEIVYGISVLLLCAILLLPKLKKNHH
jgi:hypothetical protein